MILEKFKPCKQDTWEWRLAELLDIDAIVNLARDHFQSEIDQVFTPSPDLLAKNLGVAIINQKFDKLSEQVIVAVNKNTNQLMAWAWICRGYYMTYAPEEVADARFAHVDLNLSARVRINLLAQILQQWELWAQCCAVPVLCSSTVREQQSAFLKLHHQAGFEVRGSYCYKRVDNV